MNKFHRKCLLIDTNLLLLLLVGKLNPSLIKTEKITDSQGFDEADFKQLRDFASQFQKLVTTPHILTEVSNHADKIKGANHGKFIQQFISLIEILDERSEASRVLASADTFERFGLTDTAIRQLAKENILVITVDFALAGYLHKKGLAVINFNHVRQLPQTHWTY